jgi:archaellum component FlaF (FlaF/FlaG flagellin family)
VKINPLTFEWEMAAQPRIGDGAGLTGSFDLTGTWGATAKCGTNREGSVSAALSGAGEFYPAFRLKEVSAELAGAFEFKFPRVPLLCQWTGCCHTGYCPYFQASIAPEIIGTVSMEEGEPAQFYGLKFKDAELELALTVAGTVGAGSEGSIYYIAGTIGGRPSIVLQFPADTSSYCINEYIKQVAFDLKARFVVECAWWKFEENWTFNLYTCPQSGRMMAVGCPSGQRQIVPVTRDYLTAKEGYCNFPGQIINSMGTIQFAPVSGLPAPILNVGSNPTPSVAATNDNGLLLFVYDDAEKPTGKHQEIYFARWNGSSWTAHAPLTDNMSPDIQPVAKIDSLGNEIAVWVSGPEPTGSETGPRDALPGFEITYSRWNGSAWTAPQNITNNSFADMLPWFTTKSDGTLRMCWIASPTNAIPVWHDEEIAPSLDIMASDWNGTSFGTPYTVASNRATVSPAAVIQDSTYEHLAYVKDMDNNSGTAEDREIYVQKRLLGGVWESDQRLTNDTLSDGAAQMVMNETGNPMLVWVKKMVPVTSSDPNQNTHIDQLWTSVCQNGVWSAPIKAFEYDGITEPKLFRNTAGKVVLFWIAASAEFSDIYYSVYDSALSKWGFPQQITHDSGAETMISLSESGGNILASYVKRRIDLSDPYNPPVIGLSDIYLMEHVPAKDLFVGNDDIRTTISDSIDLSKLTSFCMRWLQDGCVAETWCNNADLTQDGKVNMNDFELLASGDSLLSKNMLIDADIHLSGDFAVTDAKIQFFDGNPSSGGSLIDTRQIAQMLPGQTETVSTAYHFSSDGKAHPIYVVVDPNNVIPETDDTGNNKAFVMPFSINLVSEPPVAIGYPAADKIIVGVAVKNTGSMDSGSFVCNVRKGNTAGPILFTTSFDSVSAGQTANTQFLWDVAGEVAGIYDLVVVTDPNNTVLESQEDDNVRTGQIDVLPDLQAEQWSAAVNGTTASITVRNVGAKPSTASIARVIFNGLNLGENTVPALTPGQSADISITMSQPVQCGRVNIIVNPDSVGNDEVKLTNNTASVIRFAPADFEQNGRVDMDDLMVLVNQWLQSPGTPSADIAPDPRDNYVDLRDFERFAQFWMADYNI